MVARQSGDEFLLLLERPGSGPAILPGTEAALLVVESVAERVHELFREPFTLEGVDFTITASLGIGVFPRDAVDAKSLLSHADVAMYRSKKIGPGGYGRVLDRTRRIRCSVCVRPRSCGKAVEDESWVLHYQPVVDLTDGRILGVEALIRGRGDGAHLIPPGDFIPLAEEIGLIGAIGDWVVHETCRQSRAWADAGMELNVGFNVSPRQLWSARFATKLLNTLESAGVAPATVTIEDHRIDGHDGPGAHARHPADPPRRGVPDRDRRLRHRILVALPPEAPPDRHPEDRPVVRERCAHRP